MLSGMREAIMAAAKFVQPPHGKELVAIQGIRLLPKSGKTPARVMATRGTVGILIDIEGDVPNLVADAVGIEAAIRADPSARVSVEQDAVVVGRYRFKPWCDVRRYPGLPVIPGDERFQKIQNSDRIAQVLHAVSSDPNRPDLHCVSFRPGWCEATNGLGLARVPLAVNRTVQVHGAVFAGWQGGGVEWAVEVPIGAVFRRDGEVRWGEVYAAPLAPYPDLSRVSSERRDGVYAVVPTQRLRVAVKKAVSISPLRSVRVRFCAGGVQVASLSDVKAARSADYQETVVALCSGDGAVLLNGGAAIAALGAVDTPRVLLGYVDPQTAVRVRSGAFLEYLYPMLI